MIYTSRFSNPELRKGCYTAVRISLGTPKWDIGYRLYGEMKSLMPFGLLNKYERYEDFKAEYFKLLDRASVLNIQASVLNIQAQFTNFAHHGQDIVLLCYEDIRKGPDDWCHRTAFAEWWQKKTGELIEELPDPTTPAVPKTPKSASKPVTPEPIQTPTCEQLGLF